MEGVRATREEIGRFLSIQKYDYSSDCGSDYGDGSGPGSDDGSGFGIGYGIGYGDEYFIGYGGGFSIGVGDEFGEGFGRDEDDEDNKDCDNSDCCYIFSNDDIITLNGNIVDYIDSVPTIITQVRGNIACGYIVKKDLTLEPCYIAKVGNSFAHGNTLKYAVADAEAKEMEYMPIEERIKKFVETFDSLDSEHTGKEFYDWHHILTGSCRMGRDEFCKAHDVDLMKKYTVKYFLEITKESYGSNVIKQVRESYKSMEE